MTADEKYPAIARAEYPGLASACDRLASERDTQGLVSLYDGLSAAVSAFAGAVNQPRSKSADVQRALNALSDAAFAQAEIVVEALRAMPASKRENERLRVLVDWGLQHADIDDHCAEVAALLADSLKRGEARQ
jgi:hypothetical protein